MPGDATADVCDGAPIGSALSGSDAPAADARASASTRAVPAPAAAIPSGPAASPANRRKARAAAIAAAVVLAVAALGFAAGWAGGSDAGGDAVREEYAAAQAKSAVKTPDQLQRERNIAARYEALDIDEGSLDRVDPDEVDPITVTPVQTEPTSELARIADVDVSKGTSKVLDVPLVNQLDTSGGGRELMAGCEVASLAMVLRYAGVDVTKEELQDAMPTVPLVNGKGVHGNPNRAFVGDMAGSSAGKAGYSVYHGPVAELAQEYLMNRPFKVVDLTGQSFTALLQELASGNPCWVIATTSMQPDLVAETWKTADGDILVNWALHCVVVTGYDDGHIYINDPYGYEQNVAYDREGFEKAWKLMGSQAVTIVPTQ